MDLRPAPGKDCRLASGCPRIIARSATRPPGRVHSWPRRERDQESVGSELDAADDALACAAAGSDPTGCGGFTFRESAARPPWRACAGLSGQRHFPFAIAHEEVTLAPASPVGGLPRPRIEGGEASISCSISRYARSRPGEPSAHYGHGVGDWDGGRCALVILIGRCRSSGFDRTRLRHC